MAGEWLLGPPGDLRTLVTPEEVRVTEVRFGGIQQGLNGARTMDITGIRTNIDLTFEFLSESDYRWLQALHTRHIPGPHRLINPLRQNLLSIDAAKSNFYPSRTQGVFVSGFSTDWVNEWPTGPTPGWRSMKWSGRSAAAPSYVRWDGERKFSANAGEVVTGSVYMRSSAAHSEELRFDWFDKYGVQGTSSVQSVALTTSWARYTITATAPAGTALGRMAFIGTSTADVYFAAPQVEKGSSATDWDQGGGELMVLIDQMPALAPRFPLMNAQLTLLEA